MSASIPNETVFRSLSAEALLSSFRVVGGALDTRRLVLHRIRQILFVRINFLQGCGAGARAGAEAGA